MSFSLRFDAICMWDSFVSHPAQGHDIMHGLEENAKARKVQYAPRTVYRPVAVNATSLAFYLTTFRFSLLHSV